MFEGKLKIKNSQGCKEDANKYLLMPVQQINLSSCKHLHRYLALPMRVTLSKSMVPTYIKISTWASVCRTISSKKPLVIKKSLFCGKNCKGFLFIKYTFSQLSNFILFFHSWLSYVNYKKADLIVSIIHYRATGLPTKHSNDIGILPSLEIQQLSLRKIKISALDQGIVIPFKSLQSWHSH